MCRQRKAAQTMQAMQPCLRTAAAVVRDTREPLGEGGRVRPVVLSLGTLDAGTLARPDASRPRPRLLPQAGPHGAALAQPSSSSDAQSAEFTGPVNPERVPATLGLPVVTASRKSPRPSRSINRPTSCLSADRPRSDTARRCPRAGVAPRAALALALEPLCQRAPDCHLRFRVLPAPACGCRLLHVWLWRYLTRHEKVHEYTPRMAWPAPQC